MENFDVKAYLQKLFGDKNPIDIVYKSLVQHKDLLPNEFIIHSELMLNVPEEDSATREQFLNLLINVYVEREEYLKCQELQNIKTQLGYK